jgi:hypothetical protein
MCAVHVTLCFGQAIEKHKWMLFYFYCWLYESAISLTVVQKLEMYLSMVYCKRDFDLQFIGLCELFGFESVYLISKNIYNVNFIFLSIHE